MNTEPLIALISGIKPLSVSAVSWLRDNLKEERFEKNRVFTRDGDAGRRIYFIAKGFVRAFYYREEKRLTARFLGEGEFLSPAESFFSHKPVQEHIELLEDSLLLSLGFEELRIFLEQFPEAHPISLTLQERYYFLAEERAKILRMQSAREKYQALQQVYPGLFLRAPLGYIASFISITPETLSRLRAER